MKRWAPTVLRICVFLLLGAIVNVAVAWGCAVATRLEDRDYDFERDLGPVTFQTSVWRTRGVCVIEAQAYGHGPVVMHRTDLSVPKSVADRLRADGWDFTGFEDFNWGWSSNATYRCGWPCLALSCEFVQRGDATSESVSGALHLFGSWFRYPLPLPIVPLWPGFAINTVFYAGILWVLFALGGTPFALRRRRRIKRGLCPACAYPIGASDVCTECGKPIA